MITGGPGSGKSTLARILSARTGLPAFHMDQIHWKPGWVERTQAEKAPMVFDIIAKDASIFEGGNSTTYPQRIARADTFIWLDLPVTLRFLRVVWRTIRDHRTVRPDMAPDCPEGFHNETLDFWRYIWRTRQSGRLKLAAIAANPGHMTVHHLRSRSQVTAFIDTLPARKRTAQ